MSGQDVDRFLIPDEEDTEQATQQRIYKIIDELIERYGTETVKRAIEELRLVLLYCEEP